MKGFKEAALAMLSMVGSLALVGCQGGERYRNLVDPCYPERYSNVARQEVITAFTPQVQNGRILDQTMFNYHFEDGTDKLHPMGMKKLDEIVQRRPFPDCRIFLATSHDLAYDAPRAGEVGENRRELDVKRIAAIQQYLMMATVGRPMKFEVLIHDPADPGMSAVSARNAIVLQRNNYTGVSPFGLSQTTSISTSQTTPGGGGVGGYGIGGGAGGVGIGAGAGTTGMGPAGTPPGQ
jgi:hypothetical protein